MPGDRNDSERPGLALAGALGALVQTLVEPVEDDRDTLRDRLHAQLRRTVAAARDEALELVLDDGLLSINTRVIPREAAGPDSAIGTLVAALERQRAATLAVRRGATTEEISELARLLASVPADDAPHPWRSWSVRVTPSSGVAAPATGAVESLLRELALARDAHAVRSIVEELVAMARRIVAADGTAPAGERDAVPPEIARGSASDAGASGVGSGHDEDGRLAAIAAGLVREAARRGPRAGRSAVESGIRRILAGPTLAHLVAALPAESDRTPVLTALARAGEPSARLLVQAMHGAESLAMRRAFYDAIVALDLGDAELREALADTRWYVTRNAIALLGELQSNASDEALAPFLTHDDDRLRRAAAQALLQIATPAALHALQARLQDPDADVRRLAVAAHARAEPRPGAKGLVTALATEPDMTIRLEIIATLGALGSADAVQGLLRLAKDVDGVEREAVTDALRVARGRTPVS